MNWFFGTENSEGARTGGAWQVIKDGAADVYAGIKGFYSDDGISTMTKLGATLGAGYLIAPDTTNALVTRTVSAIGKTTSSIADTTASVATNVLKKWWPWILGGFAGWYFFIRRPD
jgi:hypothetical protein